MSECQGEGCEHKSHRPVLTIPDAARRALTEKLPETKRPTEEQVRGRRLMAAVVQNRFRRMLFGESMKPTLKQRLLVWSSLSTIKAVWEQEGT